MKRCRSAKESFPNLDCGCDCQAVLQAAHLVQIHGCHPNQIIPSNAVLIPYLKGAGSVHRCNTGGLSASSPDDRVIFALAAGQHGDYLSTPPHSSGLGLWSRARHVSSAQNRNLEVTETWENVVKILKNK